MSHQENSRNALRKKRHQRVRGKISGTSEIPRLSVFFSLKYVYAKLINDEKNLVLAEVNSLKTKKEVGENKGKVDLSKEIGGKIAKIATEKGIKKVVFDRGGYKYHGKVKALADGAREGGLIF